MTTYPGLQLRAARVFTFVCCTLILTLSQSHLFARPVPENLGNGLDKLVTNNLIQKGVITAVPAGDRTTTTSDFVKYSALINKQAASYAQRAITEATTGKYLVEIMPNGRVPMTTLQPTLQT